MREGLMGKHNIGVCACVCVCALSSDNHLGVSHFKMIDNQLRSSVRRQNMKG